MEKVLTLKSEFSLCGLTYIQCVIIPRCACAAGLQYSVCVCVYVCYHAICFTVHSQTQVKVPFLDFAKKASFKRCGVTMINYFAYRSEP